MTRPAVRPEDAVIETWECAFPGSVWVWIYDRREDVYKKQQVSQRSGSKKLHITRDDRKYNQEQIPEENQKHDPFINGHLRLLSTADRDDTLDVRNHYSDAELQEMFEVRDPDLFSEAIAAIESEVVIRRLASLSEEQATLAQSSILRELIAERWPIGGTQKTIREMIDAGERIGGFQL